MQTQSLQMADGLTLHTVNWQPAGEPKAVVLMVHGVLEHSGRYAHVADFLTQHGYAFHAYDHRGHGKSEGERAFFESPQQPVEDLRRVFLAVRAQYPDKKIFIYGHSMGSLISTLYLTQYPEDVAGYISCGTPIYLAKAFPAPLVAVASLLTPLIGKRHLIPLNAEEISRDPQVVSDYQVDPLVYFHPLRLGLALNMVKQAHAALQGLGNIKMPFFAIHGDADKVCDVRGSQVLYDGVGAADKTLKTYAGLYHEIHNDPEKATVLADVVAWLDAHA